MPEPLEVILEHADLARVIRRMAHEIVEKCAGPGELVLIGIRSRGVYLARRLAQSIGEFSHASPSVAALDITPFRDDRAYSADTSSASAEIRLNVDDKTVVLVDDVIYRGRTIRAAMDAVERAGQPERIFVAVLIDRGARELPIRADIVGKNIAAGEGQRVNVHLAETDGVDQVALVAWHGRGAR